MDKKEKYLAPQTEIVAMGTSSMIAQTTQLENPESGGDVDPWAGVAPQGLENLDSPIQSISL